MGFLKFYFAVVGVMIAIWAIGNALDNFWIALISAPAALVIVALWVTLTRRAKPPR